MMFGGLLEGSGRLFGCSLSYAVVCYQIPGTRFILFCFLSWLSLIQINKYK